MPEIAEVRLMADTISKFLKGNRITSIFATANGSNFLNGHTKHLEKIKYPVHVLDIKTNGKFCWLEIRGGGAIGIGFGMTGSIRPEPTSEFLAQFSKNSGKKETAESFLLHARLQIKYKEPNGNEDKWFYYHDVRQFGSWVYYETMDELHKDKLCRLGADILQKTVSDNDVIALFRAHDKKNICQVLMDQRVLSGVGNYIKSELLYDCRCSPYNTVADLTDEQLKEMYHAAHLVAKRGYENGGASLYTFVGYTGVTTNFADTLNVYDRTHDREGNKIQVLRNKHSPDQRTTFWVPSRVLKTASSAAPRVSIDDGGDDGDKKKSGGRKNNAAKEISDDDEEVDEEKPAPAKNESKRGKATAAPGLGDDAKPAAGKPGRKRKLIEESVDVDGTSVSATRKRRRGAGAGAGAAGVVADGEAKQGNENGDAPARPRRSAREAVAAVIKESDDAGASRPPSKLKKACIPVTQQKSTGLRARTRE